MIELIGVENIEIKHAQDDKERNRAYGTFR
nr:MAG TPA: hypothetical protein [Caudoviricetes sp.]